MCDTEVQQNGAWGRRWRVCRSSLFSFFVGINSKNVRYIFNYFFLHEKRGSTLGEGHVMLLLFGQKGTCCSCSCCRQSVDWWVRRRLRTAIRSNRLPNVHLLCVFDHLLLLVYLPQVSNQSYDGTKSDKSSNSSTNRDESVISTRGSGENLHN